MEIWIYHYKVESELNQFRFFDLIDYEDCSSENLKRFFVNHIHDREYYEWETVLIGTPDLNLTKKLNQLKEIDLTNGLKVMIVNNKESFSNFCVNEFIEKINFKYDNLSIYEIHHEGQIAYGLKIHKLMTTKSIFVDIIERSFFEIPKSYCRFFKEDFLYCKKSDLEIMHSKLKEEYRDDFFKKIISEFVSGTSIIEVGY